MSTERRQSLSERDLELIEAVIERSRRGCPDLTEQQCAALPAMIEEYKERVETAKLRREFWQQAQLKGTLYGLLFIGAFLALAVVYGGKEALAKVVHAAVAHAGG